MLSNLHVKNLALIEEENIDFEEGLNILSGETGAGKSIILGSINAALGAKTSPDFIRTGAEYGLSELLFNIEDDNVIERIKELGVIDIENGDKYWISGLKKEESNRHWAGHGKIMVDRRAVNEYLSLIGEKELPLNLFEVVDIEDRFPVKRVKELLNEKK
mgnify:CR=1 FL=1